MKGIIKNLRKSFSETIQEVIEFRGETTVAVELNSLFKVLTFCKKELGFEFLIDVSSVDHEEGEKRFEIVYELAFLNDSKHLRVKAAVSEGEEIESVVSLWKTANWHEREVFDMMGLRFKNHPNLKRILMWEGYPYHPLRKEFPLAGRETELPDVAFTKEAPMAGGPFVTSSCAKGVVEGEPKAKGES